jgi:hypothetical protein
MSQVTAPVRPTNGAIPSAYQRGWRRMLVDMEIPAWDERFLSEFDPQAMVDLYARAGASSVMFSCKALTGLCFWPTQVGQVHPGIGARDVVGETAAALEERGIAACAYYSAIYDNWAFETHPDWRIEPVGGWRAEGSPHDRHGLCCPNNPGYREYIAAQIADLYGRYDFGCAFCDMVFWPHICGCRHCRDRYRAEAGADLPDTVDWTSVEWCTFQFARERWIDEFTGLVTDAMRAARPGIAVYHNFALGPVGWTRGVPFSVTEHNDFLGGDLYGDEIEQLVVIKLMNNLSRSRPVEFMTFATPSPLEHVQLKSPERMRAQVLAAAAESAAFMFIEAIDPIGTANPESYELIGETFEAAAPFEPYLGGEAIEDVAVYFSSESKMNFGDNGTALEELMASFSDYPHMHAVRGACRSLQRAHIPFGVITRRQLGELDRYRVVVLPNVARMDANEVEAIREYVRGGGRVYASKYTSLVESRGVRHENPMLGDVFGVAVQREEATGPVYAKPATAATSEWLEPQKFLSATPSEGALDGGLLRLSAEPAAHVLATLSLPRAHPLPGSALDHNWASIHAFPPWEHTAEPAIVQHEFGAGRAIYSAFDIESDQADASDRLFAALARDLLGDDWSISTDTHPDIWVSGFRQPDEDAIRIALFNPPPARVAGARLSLRAPEGCRFTAVEEVLSSTPVSFECDAGGTLHCTIAQVPELTMLLARHERS